MPTAAAKPIICPIHILALSFVFKLNDIVHAMNATHMNPRPRSIAPEIRLSVIYRSAAIVPMTIGALDSS